MAKYPFAEQAKATLEEAGIVFNPDGTTSVAEKTAQEEQVTQPEPTLPADSSNEQTPPTESSNEQKQPPVDEKDNLISIQREAFAQREEEINQLRNQLQNTSSNTVTKSARETELEKQLADLQSKLKDQTLGEQADQFRELLEKQGFDSENLDDDALLEIRDMFFKPMAAKVQALEEKLATYDDKFREPTAEEKVEQVKRETFSKIIEEVPDFNTIFKSKAFQEKLAKKDERYPTATYGGTLQIAYETGDHNFIIKEVKAFLNGGANQNISDVADVGASKGVGAGTQQADGSAEFTYTNDEALEMLRKRQMGDLTATQYSEYRAKFEEHKSRKG